MRPSHVWGVTRRSLAAGSQRFGTTDRLHLQGFTSPRATTRPLKKGPKSCQETSVSSCQPTPRNTAEKRKPQNLPYLVQLPANTLASQNACSPGGRVRHFTVPYLTLLRWASAARRFERSCSTGTQCHLPKHQNSLLHFIFTF